MPDIILVSPRHLFRMPYSLHEKTTLASVVIDKSQVSEFKTSDADPLRVRIKKFYPDAEEEEAREEAGEELLATLPPFSFLDSGVLLNTGVDTDMLRREREDSCCMCSSFSSSSKSTLPYSCFFKC